jgi:nicotinate-nucleotide adenylyltransferase
MRIGLFGGSFNPVHAAHLRLADRVCRERELDEVILMPARQPPHKLDYRMAPGADRLAMLELATADDPRLVVSDLELRREGKSYTLLTVRQLRREQLAPDDDLFLLVGGDMLADLPNWWRADELVAEVEVMATGRPGDELQDALDAFCAEVPHEVCRRTRELAVRMEPMDISSTAIRRRCAEGQPIDGLVPDVVRDYIAEHALYRATSGETE